MSIEAMVWALEQQNLDPVDKLTLLGIANHADRFGGNAFPAISTIALYVGRSEMTVRRSLRRLEERGLVAIRIQGGGSSRHGGYRPNLYTLAIRGLTDDTPSGERGLIGETAGLSSTRGEGYQGSVRRTVLEPSENRPTDCEAFDEWWKTYPKRVGRRAALTAFQKALRGKDAPTVESLIEGARRLANEGREFRFIPHPATWLNQGRWDDEIPATTVIVEEVPKPVEYCGECTSGWVLREDREGVSRAYSCLCVSRHQS